MDLSGTDLCHFNLFELKSKYPDARLVIGNTEVGIEMRLKRMQYKSQGFTGETNELQGEENKALPEKNKRRRFKTPSQLQALEDFYNEHKYPTESMKAELADHLGLTEKQISGWFCHRRLKDKRIVNGELNPPGRQDLSSGVIQDRGSGLRQDSCSSTKQGDYRLSDVREVESRRFGHNDLPAAEIKYERRMLDDGTEMDDTSSESNSALPGSFYPHNRSPLN
ncbi:hypothetical protein BVRB_017650, partial [Beta vulgaris subsp. vulgaris]